MTILEAMHDHRDGEPTVVLARRVRPGHEAEFEAWAQGFTETLMAFPGCLRCQVVPPVEGAQTDWVFVSTFQDPASLKAWISSEPRRQSLKQVEPMVENTGQIRVISGLETLFGLVPPAEAKPPAVWKLAAVTQVGLYPTVIFSWLYVAPHLQRLSLLPRALCSSLFTVVAMTWVVMPIVTRLFRPWLLPRS